LEEQGKNEIDISIVYSRLEVEFAIVKEKGSSRLGINVG
jgi:hypothetical protein